MTSPLRNHFSLVNNTKAPPEREIPAIIAKLKVENGYKAVNQACLELIDTIDDPDVHAGLAKEHATGYKTDMFSMKEAADGNVEYKIKLIMKDGEVVLHSIGIVDKFGKLVRIEPQANSASCYRSLGNLPTEERLNNKKLLTQ